MQQADQTEPAAEPVPPHDAAVAAVAVAVAAPAQTAPWWQRGAEAAVHGLGQEVAPPATREGPPAPVFGGGQVLRTVLAIQGGLHGLPGPPDGTRDPILVELEEDYEILPAMGE